MTAPADVQQMLQKVVSQLTGPGGRFEVAVENVRGNAMPVMTKRDRRVADIVVASKAWGDRDYIVTADRRISFAQHADAVAALATTLRDEYGVGKGDRVAILAANSPEWIITFWATQCLGAITVGLNSWWVPAEIAYGVEMVEPKVIVTDAKRAALLTKAEVSGFEQLTMEEDVPRIVSARPVPISRSPTWTRTIPPSSCSPAAPADVPRVRCTRSGTCSPSSTTTDSTTP